MTGKTKIAFWHRYGPGGHPQECHSVAPVVKKLAGEYEVHYFGMRTRNAVPKDVLDNAVLHYIPFRANRASMRNKALGMLVWYFFMPWMALRCRWMGAKLIYMDETLPLSAAIARLFFGGKVVITVADFFLDVYFSGYAALRPLCRLIERIDMATWRKLPLIFTKVKYTAGFLAARGVDPARICPVYNPCDRTIYHPVDRTESRRSLNISPDDLVIVHHGILHPNKGNDRILKALSELRSEIPAIRYILVGHGPEMNNLKRLAREIGFADRMTFTGWLPALADVNRALNCADIGLVMRIGQKADNFHMTDTLAHEMACGLPILSARLAGIAEVIRDGESGFLFDPGDMDEFKEKFRRLAVDSELRRNFARASLALSAQYFDITKVSDQIADALVSAMRQDREFTTEARSARR